MIHLKAQIASERFPEDVAVESLGEGYVVWEVLKQRVSVEALEVVDAAPAVRAEG